MCFYRIRDIEEDLRIVHSHIELIDILYMLDQFYNS